jgi:uncharacterized membrane-anchored protein
VSATEGVIGMIFPEDAGKIDYDQLLKSIQEDEKKQNVERTKAGFPEIHLVGWAQNPIMIVSGRSFTGRRNLNSAAGTMSIR